MRDPEFRRDLLTVIGLFALGILINGMLTIVAIWILQQLGWFDLTPLTVDLDLGMSGRGSEGDPQG